MSPVLTGLYNSLITANPDDPNANPDLNRTSRRTYPPNCAPLLAQDPWSTSKNPSPDQGVKAVMEGQGTAVWRALRSVSCSCLMACWQVRARVAAWCVPASSLPCRCCATSLSLLCYLFVAVVLVAVVLPLCRCFVAPSLSRASCCVHHSLSPVRAPSQCSPDCRCTVRGRQRVLAEGEARSAGALISVSGGRGAGGRRCCCRRCGYGCR